VRLVVGAEVERVQHQRQHAPVMRAVGVVNDCLKMPAIDRPGGLALGHEVMQGLLADGRENHVAHGAVRLGDAGRGQLEQQRRLAGNALEVGNQFAFDALLGFRADVRRTSWFDAMHRGDEQVGQAVGDLALAHVAEGGEQGQADRVGVPAQLMQLLGRDPAAVGEHHARRHAIEQAAGQRQGAVRRSLSASSLTLCKLAWPVPVRNVSNAGGPGVASLPSSGNGSDARSRASRPTAVSGGKHASTAAQNTSS